MEIPKIALKNLQTGAVEEHAYDDVQNLVNSGQYVARKSETFDITHPETGEAGSVTGESLAAALKAGALIDKYADVKKREWASKYDDAAGAALAGAAGAARGLTFGLSDQALTKIAGVKPDTLEGLREIQPVISTGSEVVATAAGLLSGIGEAGAAVKGASTVAGLAGKAAEKVATAGVEKLIAKEALKSGVSQSVAKATAAKIVPRIVENGLEAGAYGLGQLNTEQALGNADFNAESVLAAVGPAALIGGGIGGVFGTFQSLKPLASDVGSKLSAPVRKFMDRETAAAGEFSAAQIKKFNDSKLGQQFLKDMPDFMKNNLDLKVTDTAAEKFAKAEALQANAFKTVDDVAEHLESKAVAGELKNQVTQRELAEKAIKELEEKRAELVRKVTKSEEIALEAGAPNAWDKLQPKNKDLDATQITGARPSIIKETVEDVVTPENQSAVNYLDKQLQYYREMAKSSDVMTPKQLVAELRALGAEKYDAAVGNVKAEVLQSLRDIYSGRLHELTLDNAVKMAKSVSESNKIANMAKTYADSIESRAIADKAGKIGGIQDAAATALALATGHPIAALGLAAAAIGRRSLNSESRRNLAVLFDLVKAANKTEKYITKSMDKFFDVGGAAVKPLAARKIAESHLAYDLSGAKPTAPKNEQAALNNLRNNIRLFSEQPDRYVEMTGRYSAPYAQYIPRTLESVDIKSVQALQFIASKLSVRVSQAGMIENMQDNFKLSSQEKSKLQRYINAAENPLSVFSDLAHGQLSREGAETLRTLYPEMYGKLQERVASEMAENGSKLSYQKKLQLGLIMDTATDSSMLPQNVASLQSIINNPQANKNTNQISVPVENMQSESERITTTV